MGSSLWYIYRQNGVDLHKAQFDCSEAGKSIVPLDNKDMGWTVGLKYVSIGSWG